MLWMWLLIIVGLKVPGGIGAWIAWRTFKNVPEVAPAGDDDGGSPVPPIEKRHPRRPPPRGPLPRTPRRGPHGEPAPLPPPRVRLVRVRARSLDG